MPPSVNRWRLSESQWSRCHVKDGEPCIDFRFWVMICSSPEYKRLSDQRKASREHFLQGLTGTLENCRFHSPHGLLGAARAGKRPTHVSSWHLHSTNLSAFARMITKTHYSCHICTRAAPAPSLPARRICHESRTVWDLAHTGVTLSCQHQWIHFPSLDPYLHLPQQPFVHVWLL